MRTASHLDRNSSDNTENTRTPNLTYACNQYLSNATKQNGKLMLTVSRRERKPLACSVSSGPSSPKACALPWFSQWWRVFGGHSGAITQHSWFACLTALTPRHACLWQQGSWAWNSIWQTGCLQKHLSHWVSGVLQLDRWWPSLIESIATAYKVLIISDYYEKSYQCPTGNISWRIRSPDTKLQTTREP